MPAQTWAQCIWEYCLVFDIVSLPALKPKDREAHK